MSTIIAILSQSVTRRAIILETPEQLQQHKGSQGVKWMEVQKRGDGGGSGPCGGS